MTCYVPVTLYMSRVINPLTGKRSLVTLQNGFRDKPRQVACGRCIGCRLERSRQWAIRCVHEAQMHELNTWLTLTYRDEELIYGGAEHGILYPRHLELFWKRLRKYTGKRLRYFACGEYGDESSRPHYHACVFGYDFPDKKIDTTKDGIDYYHSDMLDNIWTHGRCIIGALNFETAAYTARYIMKKRLGQEAESYVKQGIEPEFVRMSRRPGIGATWFDKYESDVFPSDYTIIREGIKSKPPKYYSSKYSLTHPLTMEEIKEARIIEAYKHLSDNSPQRLRVRERIKNAQARQLLRKLS